MEEFKFELAFTARFTVAGTSLCGGGSCAKLSKGTMTRMANGKWNNDFFMERCVSVIHLETRLPAQNPANYLSPAKQA
jgi:hypothetical protein